MANERGVRVIQAVIAAALVATAIPIIPSLLPAGPLKAVDASAQEAQPGRIAVDLKDNVSQADFDDFNADYRLSLDPNSEFSDRHKLFIDDVDPAGIDALLERLRKDKRVEAASRLYDYSIPPQEMTPSPDRDTSAAPTSGKGWRPNDPRYAEQWNMKLIGAEQAWEATRAKGPGKGVIVAVIDTGVAYADLEKGPRGKDFAGTKFVPGYDFVNDDSLPWDDNGHGTHVAGTIAETTNNEEGVAGLAFDAEIMPLKVLSGSGSGSSADIADAVRFAADHGAKIINMSLGGPFPDDVMRNACKYAKKKGVLIVCAAGNSGGRAVGYPAAFPECLAVSSVGPTGEIAYYSSVGKPVAIAAPGGDKQAGEEFGILQNTILDGDPNSNDYYGFQGTSMASPHVAATAALVMSRGVTDADEVRRILQQAATPKKPQTKYGAGILNAAKSVELTDDAHRDSFMLVLATLMAAGLGTALGVFRDRAKGLLRFPIMPLGFIIGALGPDWLFGWLGFSSPFNLLFHSALIPMFLMWEAKGSSASFVSAVAMGVGLHLGWDAYNGHVPFAGIVPSHAMPWLWANTAAAGGVAVIALVRSFLRR